MGLGRAGSPATCPQSVQTIVPREIPYQVFDGYRRLVGRDVYRFTVMV